MIKFGETKRSRERRETPAQQVHREQMSGAIKEIATEGLLSRIERMQEQFSRARRLSGDVIEEIEAAMIEAGNKHSETCDKQRHLPCSCGFSELVKARKIAASLSAVLG